MRFAVLLLILSHVISQRIEEMVPVPDRCQVYGDIMYRQCCVFPPFFTREVATGCGALLTLMFTEANVTALRRRAVTGCDHWRCVLKKYDLITAEDTLDDEKYYTHLNKWVDLNPVFSNVMLNAKINCKLRHRHMLPMEICEFYNLHACIRNFVNLDCPIYMNTESCDQVKQFNDECREFYQ